MTTPFLSVPIFYYPGAPSGLLSTFIANSTTPQVTYSDAAGTVPNTNPVVLDTTGAAIVRLGAGLAYDFVLKDQTGTTTLWSALNYVQPLQSITLTQATIGGLLYPQSAAEISAGVSPTNLAYPPLAIDRYGTNSSPGTTDMLAAINAAISVAFAAGGGIVQGQATTYFHSAGLTNKAGVTLRGAGKTATVFLSSHTGNGITSTLALNNSNNADTEIRDCTFKNTNASNTGGGLVDTAGTFVRGRNVRVNGFAYSRIFNQTELGDDDLMDFEGFLIGGVWLTNGADFTIGATAGFTNRISVNRSQFNSIVAGSICVIDDGGAAHDFMDNNYNACAHHFRIAGCKNITIGRGEYESASGGSFLFRSTTSVLGTSVGTTDNCTIDGIWISPPAGTAIVFTVPPVGSGGILTPAWTGLTGQYNITFSDAENRTATLTNGSTAATWTAALTGTPTATGNTAIAPVADIAASTLVGMVVRNNRTISSGPTFLGTPNLNTLFAYGNEDSNAGSLFDGLAASNHFEHAVARSSIQIKGNLNSASAIGVNGATAPAQVVGWGTPTNPSILANFNGAGATLAQTSGVVAEILTYLKARGDFAT